MVADTDLYESDQLKDIIDFIHSLSACFYYSVRSTGQSEITGSGALSRGRPVLEAK